MGYLALISMGLGDKAAAFKLIEQAMAVISIEKDAVAGPIPIEFLARVSARMGEPDRAIAALTETALDTVRWRTGSKRATYSCAAPARSDVRSVAERCALPIAGIGRGETVKGSEFKTEVVSNSVPSPIF